MSIKLTLYIKAKFVQRGKVSHRNYLKVFSPMEEHMCKQIKKKVAGSDEAQKEKK